METNVPAPAGCTEFEAKGSELIEAAGLFSITDDRAYQEAGYFLNRIKTVVNKVEVEFNGTPQSPGPVTLAYHTWKAAVLLREKVLGRYTQAEEIMKGKIGDYLQEQAEKRRQDEANALLEAKKREEEERLAKAEKMAQNGDLAGADAILEAPINPVLTVPLATAEPPRVKGISARLEWDFRIVDASKLPRKYLVADERAIRQVVKALGKECEIPGVAVFQKTIVGSRGNA